MVSMLEFLRWSNSWVRLTPGCNCLENSHLVRNSTARVSLETMKQNSYKLYPLSNPSILMLHKMFIKSDLLTIFNWSIQTMYQPTMGSGTESKIICHYRRVIISGQCQEQSYRLFSPLLCLQWWWSLVSDSMKKQLVHWKIFRLQSKRILSITPPHKTFWLQDHFQCIEHSHVYWGPGAWSSF